MPWYKTGTVSVVKNSNAVIGTSTAFISNGRVGDAWRGPDGAWYEVINIASDTALSIAPSYQGDSTAVGFYALAPMQGYPKDLSDQVKQIIQQWGATLASIGSVASQNVVPVAMGGTGGTTQAAARDGLGLGSAATKSIVPIAMGGTGGTTPATARDGLGLGSAATATVGIAEGNVLAKGAFGLGGSSRYVTTNPDSSPLGGGFHYYGDQTGGASAANNRFGIRFGFGTGLSQGFELLNDPWTTRYYLRSSSSNAGAPWYTPVEIYTTGNTTRAADGTLKAI